MQKQSCGHVPSGLNGPQCSENTSGGHLLLVKMFEFVKQRNPGLGAVHSHVLMAHASLQPLDSSIPDSVSTRKDE